MNTQTKTLSVLDCEFVFAVPGGTGIIDVINPVTGLSWYNGENLEQVRIRYPGAEIFNWDDWNTARAAEQDTPVSWYDIPEEQYDNWLNCLPPAYMGNLGFMVGEPWDHHAKSGLPRYQACVHLNGQHLASNRPMTVKEFRAYPVASIKAA